jgi:hypothetical protein
MNPNIDTLNNNKSLLISNSKPRIELEQLRTLENEKMFQFLPVLRNQSQFPNNHTGYIPNRELNTILNQERLNNLINRKDGSRVYPPKSFGSNFFPSQR